MSDPFGGIPFFGDLSRLLGQQGPIAWDAATQLASSIATEGQPEANVDPLERIRLEQLARVAEVQLSGLGLDTAPGGQVATIEPVTRAQWVQRALLEFRPRFEVIAAALGATGASGPASEASASSGPAPSSAPASGPADEEPLDPAFIGLEDLRGLGADLDAATPTAPAEDDDESDGDWLGGLLQMLSPMLLGMTAGSLVGHLALRSFGLYDLPLPRRGASLTVVPATLDAFGSAWSLDPDDLRLWVCLHELAHHAVLGRPHVGTALDELVTTYAAGFRPDPDALERNLGDLDPTRFESVASFQQLMGDPEVLLGAEITPAQAALRPRIDTLVATVVGYVDTVMDQIGERLIGSYDRVTEAVRRHRVEAGDADRFIDRLFGLDLSQDLYDRGAAFCDGVIERADFATLDQLWISPDALPTQAEIVAPGLWLARLDLSS